MHHSTARTGPHGLVRPTPPTSTPAPIDGDLETLIADIRRIAARPNPAPLADSTRFAIETAKGLADHAPDLYPMTTEVAARFRLISNFLTTALDEADQQQAVTR